MISWVMLLAVGILIGVGIGIYISRLDDAAKRKELALTKQLQETDQQLAHYRQQVQDHFKTTASLVNRLTDSYREVHEHLATGAATLCGKNEVIVEQLEIVPQPMLEEIADEEAVETVSEPAADQRLSVAPSEQDAEILDNAEQTADSLPAKSEDELTAAALNETQSDGVSQSTEIVDRDAESVPSNIKPESELSEIDQSRINASRMVH